MDGRYYAPDEMLDRMEANGQVVLRYAPGGPHNGSARDICGVVNEAGNVMGLMPHPEHAVDPLLGSEDGALLLAGLVDAARERLAMSAAAFVEAPPRSRADARSGCSRNAARRRSRSRPRSVTGPRRTVPSVEYAIRTSGSPRSVCSSSTTVANRFSPARCGTVTCSTTDAEPHGVDTRGAEP